VLNLCYAELGRGQAPSPDPTPVKKTSFQSPALFALNYIAIDQQLDSAKMGNISAAN